MNNNNLEQLVIELFQHIEFTDGEWYINTEDGTVEGYSCVTPPISEIFDALESALQDSPSVEEDEASY